MALGPNICPNGDFELDENWSFDNSASRQSSSPPSGGSGYYAHITPCLSTPNFSQVRQDLIGIVEFDVLYQIDVNFEVQGWSSSIYLGGTNPVGKVDEVPLQGTFADDYILKFVSIGPTNPSVYSKVDNVQLREVFVDVSLLGFGFGRGFGRGFG